MKIDQIIVREETKLILIQHTDALGRAGVTVVNIKDLDSVQADALAVFLAFCRDKTPMEPQKPRLEVEREIADLEGRLDNLRQALAVAVGEVDSEAKDLTP